MNLVVKGYSIDLLDQAGILQYNSKQILVKTIIVLSNIVLNHTVFYLFIFFFHDFVTHQFHIHNEKIVLLMNTSTFFVLKSTLGRRLEKAFVNL